MKQLFLACLILCTLSFGLSTPVCGQGFGSYPPGSDWKQINTPEVRVIFKPGMEAYGRRVTDIIRHVEKNNRYSIGERKQKLDLILNNFGSESNGYVTLAPFRSEFFTTPFPNSMELGSLDWVDLLSIHEYRHALQYMNFRRGWFGVAYALFGQTSLAALMNLTVPDWYFEGDAVMTETALTRQGRGRLPSFTSNYRALILEDQQPSYELARNGSYNKLIPDHYPLGYLLCTYGREKYGDSLWMQVNRKTAYLSGLIYPFSQGIQAYARKKSFGLYREAMEYYKEEWTRQLETLPLTPGEPVTEPAQTVTHFHFPFPLSDGELITRKNSFTHTAQLVFIDSTGAEETIVSQGIMYDPYFSTNGQKFCWTEVSWHPRYDAVNYSDIHLYDWGKNAKTRITRGERLFGPAISPDGNSILALSVSETNHYRVVKLNLESGQTTDTLPNPDNLYYSYPKWTPDGKEMVVSARKANGDMGIIRQNMTTGHMDILVEFVNQVIGPVYPCQNGILFTCPTSGIDNVFIWWEADHQVYQLTSSKYGAYEPALSPDGQWLYFTETHPSGRKITRLPMNVALWEHVQLLPLERIASLNQSYMEREGGNILDGIASDSEAFPVQPYRPLGHLLRVHSWSLSPGFESIGAHLYSDDVLSQFHLDAGVDYYYNETALGYSLSAQYGGLFPLISLSAGKQYRVASLSGYQDVRYQENNLTAGLRVPLLFTRGPFVSQFLLGGEYAFSRVTGIPGVSVDMIGQPMLVSSAGINLKWVIRKLQAHQQLTTPFGIGLELSFNQSLNNAFASQFQSFMDFAIRGLFPTHNFTATAGFKFEGWFNDYRFLDTFIYPRGYSIPAYHWMQTIQTNYHFPLLYPDFGIIGIVYFKRVRANLFADIGFGDIVNLEASFPTDGVFTSLGGELIFDTRWLNLVPISLGIRSSLLLNPDPFIERQIPLSIEFFIPVFRL